MYLRSSNEDSSGRAERKSIPGVIDLNHVSWQPPSERKEDLRNALDPLIAIYRLSNISEIGDRLEDPRHWRSTSSKLLYIYPSSSFP
jgi:hypothetical protein